MFVVSFFTPPPLWDMLPLKKPCMQCYIYVQTPISHESTKSLGIKTQVHTKGQKSDWLVYLTVFHMIGRSKMNEMSYDMTPSPMACC